MGQAGCVQDPAHGAGRHDDPFALSQQVSQVRPIDPRVCRQGALHQAITGARVDPVDGAPAEVAVDQARHALAGSIAGQEAAHRANREPELLGCLIRRDLAGQHMVQDIQPPLRTNVQVDRLPLHDAEGDKVAGRSHGQQEGLTRVTARPSLGWLPWVH